MEQKFKDYRKFDWTLNARWQNYLDNIFPTPSRDRLEKIRRKWYRDNVDKEFDLTYEPSAQNDESSQQQQRPAGGNAYNNFMNQQYQYQNQQNYVDALPSLKTQQWILWTIFYITLPLRLYTNWLVFGALLVGIIKRHGIPKFSKDYLQKIMFDDNLQMLPYLGVVAVAGSANFILYMPIILHGYLEVSPLFKEILDRKPNALIISTNMVKGYILKGVQHKAQFIELKSDMEVYIGFYLIAVWFIGWSSLISILMYWQILRLRYMISAHTQGAFKRIDVKIKTVTGSPRCPAMVRGLYLKATGLLGSMVEVDVNQGGSGSGAGGLLSKCNIF